MDYCYTGIKKYIVGLIIRTSSDASALEREKVYLGKLNMILVQVQRMVIITVLSTTLCFKNNRTAEIFYYNFMKIALISILSIISMHMT